ESSMFVRYSPGATSLVSTNTGDIPACDMFPSSLISAPTNGFREASRTRSLISTWPTRGACGKTSCATKTSCDDGLLQLMKPATKKHKRHNSPTLLVPFVPFCGIKQPGVVRDAKRSYTPPAVLRLVETDGSTSRSPSE